MREQQGQNKCVSDAAERLRRRYPKPRMPRPLLVGLISVGVVLALTWLVWTALRYSKPVAAAEVQAFQITSDTSVSVTISVQRPDPSVPVTCRVLAQAADFQPVGEQQVPIVASTRQVVDVSLVLTTLRRATAVVIKGCAAV
jgi:cytoskeletal protein RodZ